MYILYFWSFFAELGSTKGLHSYPGTDRNDHWGLLEDGLARKGLLYSHGHKNFRLHQGKHFSTIIKLFSIYKAIKTFDTKQKIVILEKRLSVAEAAQ